MLLWNKPTIAREIRRRNIRLLLHSTHLYKNLPRIFEYGRLETAGTLVNKLGKEKASRYLHDPVRYEQFSVGLDYLNCALTVPNYELLYHRSKNNWGAEWVHFAFDLNLLERAETLFSRLSAAQERGAYLQSGLVGFQKLFDPVVESFNRGNLKSDEPTHPQAEVLIHGSLPIENIQAIHVPNAEVASEVERAAQFYSRQFTIEISPHLFVWPKRLLKPE